MAAAAAAAASTAALTLRGLQQYYPGSRSIPIILSPGRRIAILPSRRSLSNTPKMTTAFAETDAKEPIFAAGVDRDQFLPPTRALLEEGQWTLDEECMGVTKTFYFKTYTKCLVRIWAIRVIAWVVRLTIFLHTGLRPGHRHPKQVQEPSLDHDDCKSCFCFSSNRSKYSRSRSRLIRQTDAH